MVQSWLVKNCDTQVFLRAIGFRHLKESINFSNSRDVLGDEGLDLGLEVYLLGLVTLDVLEQFFDLIRHGQVSIGSWVVSSWNFLLILVILVIFSRLLNLWLLLHLGHLSWLLGLLLSSSCGMLNIYVDIDLIILFVRLNLLAVVDIDCQVKRLVVNFLALNLRILYSFPVCRFVRTA